MVRLGCPQRIEAVVEVQEHFVPGRDVDGLTHARIRVLPRSGEAIPRQPDIGTTA